jgi:hypothetical protein
MRAALLGNKGTVIGEVFDAPEKGNTIEVAGAFTNRGEPVNVDTLKISRSKRNMQKARFEQPVTKVGDVWTFSSVEDGRVVY